MFRRLLTYQVAVDSVLATAFFIVAVWVELKAPDSTVLWGAVGGILVCTVFAAAVLLRRLAPALALAAAWVGGILQMAFGRQPSLADLAVPIVVYAAAAYGSRTMRRWGLVSAIVGALVGGGYVFIVLSGPSRQWTPAALLTRGMVAIVGAASVLLLAWTAGTLATIARRVREGHRARLHAEEQAEAEAERVRIARDMHDVVAHSLAVVIAQADGARYAAASDPDATAQALGTISATGRAALADVRALLAQLRHAQDDGPAPTLADLDELFARTRTAGLELRVSVDPVPPADVATAVQLAAYRILQEVLTNALRHGDGEADVTLAWHPDHVDMVVRNMLPRPRPGRDTGADVAAASGPAPRADIGGAAGAAPPHGPSGHGTRAAGGDADGGAAGSAPGAPRGHGLIGMRERARLVGGTLDVAADGAEFVLRARLPTAPGEADE